MFVSQERNGRGGKEGDKECDDRLSALANGLAESAGETLQGCPPTPFFLTIPKSEDSWSSCLL